MQFPTLQRIQHEASAISNELRNFSLPAGLMIMLLTVISPICFSQTGEQLKLSSKDLIANDLLRYPAGRLHQSHAGQGWKSHWKLSQTRPPISILKSQSVLPRTGSPVIRIQGTSKRNNPLRRELAKPIRSQEIFISFSFRYNADRSPDRDTNRGEFFVCWLDRLDGSDSAVHANGVPNIGVHIPDRGPQKGKNLFMVRIGQQHVAWSPVELKRDRTYQVVSRLSKSQPGDREDYDRLELWVDPHVNDRDRPIAKITQQQSINVIRWVGFATGRKTEKDDQIRIGDLRLSRTWNGVLSSSAFIPSRQPAPPDKIVWTKKVDFKHDIYPLLKARCFTCHAGKTPESGYRLDAFDELLGNSNGEPLVVPGASDKSRLIELVSSTSAEEKMPPTDGGKALTQKEIALLRAWIDQGLSWDHKLLPPPVIQTDHWAFQPIKRPQIPDIPGSKGRLQPVDAFIRNVQLQKGILPNSSATSLTLIRRLYLDIIGLPPTAEELQEFRKNISPQAYEKLVETLLNSPHYGERWGRYWLDLARWTESMGYQHDIPRPYAWRYRDYVIQSFNEDKPYSQFLKEQIAGDEILPVTDNQLIATGFLAAARINGNQMDKLQQRNDILVDMANVTGSVILGLTLECAQCHNHKFDPISQRDYYRLHGFFVNGQIRNLMLQNPKALNPLDLASWMPADAVNFYHRERKKLKIEQPKQPHTWGYYSPLTGSKHIRLFPVVNRSPLPYYPDELTETKPRLLIRGNAGKPGPELKPGWPEVLGPTPEFQNETPRIAFANWLANRNNPLVARVWVNRIWQYHFGKGLVATSSDFGLQGSPPSHPKLLDWLAAELMDNQWSTKHIHRLILLSKTYQQSKKLNPSNLALDLENQYLWRWTSRRLEAEAIRDSVLVATGELDRTTAGPSVAQEKEEKSLRRTIYLFQRRSDMPAVMAMFDAPAGRSSCSRRGVSTVALQPLYLLNSQFMSRRSQSLANLIQQQVGDSLIRQIELAFERTLCRPPSQSELVKSTEILTTQIGKSPTLTFPQFCQALLNLNEFLYIP